MHQLRRESQSAPRFADQQRRRLGESGGDDRAPDRRRRRGTPHPVGEPGMRPQLAAQRPVLPQQVAVGERRVQRGEQRLPRHRRRDHPRPVRPQPVVVRQRGPRRRQHDRRRLRTDPREHLQLRLRRPVRRAGVPVRGLQHHHRGPDQRLGRRFRAAAGLDPPLAVERPDLHHAERLVPKETRRLPRRRPDPDHRHCLPGRAAASAGRPPVARAAGGRSSPVGDGYGGTGQGGAGEGANHGAAGETAGRNAKPRRPVRRFPPPPLISPCKNARRPRRFPRSGGAASP